MKINGRFFALPRRMVLGLALLCGLAAPATGFNLDIDDDGNAEPLTDGLLVIRYLFGFSGSSLINGAIAGGGTRSESSEIEAYLEANRALLDIDGDGEALALTDGLLVIRYLFGFSGDALIQGAIGPQASRKLAANIETKLEAVLSGSGGSEPLADANEDWILDRPYSSGAQFNAQAIALSDHVDGRSSPTFYGLKPGVSGGVLGLDLEGAAIDLSHIQATINGDARQGASARVLFLLDRVPAAGANGSLTFAISLIDGFDSSVDAGEREFKTSFDMDWSSDGSFVTFSAPVQDQVVNYEQVGTATTYRVKYTIESVQPTLLTARVPTEFPGYPLALEIQLLELFDDSLVAKLRDAGLYDLVANYFDNGSDYYLAVDLAQASGASTVFLGYQGLPFEQIQGQIKVVDVSQSASDGFNLSHIDAGGVESESGYVLNLQAETLTLKTISQGLFTSLCGAALCFEPLSGAFISSQVLKDQVARASATQAVSAIGQFSNLPQSTENLTYRVTWTQGNDNVRTGSEAKVTFSVPLQFTPDSATGSFKVSGGASIARVDNASCTDAGACERLQINLVDSPVTGLAMTDNSLLGLQMGLLPITSAADIDTYLESFFKAGDFHVRIELFGRTGLLSYEQQTITALEGTLLLR